MTQTEQNSAFRSREAQEDSLTYHLGGLQAAKNFRRLARAMIQEAEARGAEEQRRKDAEVCEAVYQYQYSDQSWCDTSREAYERHTALDPNDTRILYTRPANVAALEAALKAIGDEVLEGSEPFRHAVVRILKTVGIDPLNGAEPEDMEITLKERVEDLERVCRHVVWTEEKYGLGSRGHDSAVQIARSALTHEGAE
ncbi:MAG: hypothetical protein ABF443_15295 [Acetobacter malorum]|uniref:hypothetical protein n=1 Tax=Acetobacter malorum TaxID=178901 RepID=UPI0039EC82B1